MVRNPAAIGVLPPIRFQPHAHRLRILRSRHVQFGEQNGCPFVEWSTPEES
jgi:hypothetical protein